MKRSLSLLAAIMFIMAGLCISVAAEPTLKTTTISPDTPWAAPGSVTPLPERQHPLLFLGQDDFKRVSTRAESTTWAAAQMTRLRAAADEALTRKLEIPDKPGEWSHHYVCKVCGIDLTRRDGKNICPRCGREYSGWPYDGVIAGRKHHANIDDAENLGLMYQLTQNPAYAARCREILLGYADRYLNYPIHDYRGGKDVKGARLFAQTLDESVRMIPMVWAYDMIYDAPMMTPADREKIEDKLFRPAALVIRRNDMGISNWQSWHNAAMAAIGFVLNDPAMIEHAVNGKSGIHFQMKHSVLPDGFWYEGTASYHFYALQALQKQAMAMKGAGMNLYEEPVFKSLYEAPLDYVFPDGRFPAVNDSDPISISSQAEFYEVAYAWYDRPEFAAVADLDKRKSMAAFLWGADSLPDVKLQHHDSHNFPGVGAIMLRQGADPKNPLALHMDYGPHGGAHGHPDKLGIIFFANGTEVIPDPGRLAYAAPLHKKWYKTTLAHNTVIVDGKNQEPTQARLIASDFDGPIKLATAACDTAYKDVVLTRSIALAPNYMLDVVSGSSPDKHTWDLAYHIEGKPESSLDFKDATLPEKSDGYQVLDNIRTAMLLGNMKSGERMAEWSMVFHDSGRRGAQITLLQTSSAGREIILADGVTGGDVTTCPVVLSRTRVPQPVWISLVIPGEATADDWTCEATDDGWEITVRLGGRTDKYHVRQGQISVRAD